MKTIRLALLMCLALTVHFEAFAEKGFLDLDFYTRVEYNFVSGTDACSGETSGFRGRHIYVRANGDLGHGFSYSIAHRLNNINTVTKYFDSTDWSWLAYTTPDEKWTFTAGKIVMLAGSFEWDLNPIHVPFFTGSVNLVNPYQIGASVSRALTPEDALTFICTRSQYDTELDNCLTYTLEWRGIRDCWQNIYVAQFVEEAAMGGFLQFGLGNIFTLGPLSLDLDLMARTSPFYADSWRHIDMTLNVKLDYPVSDKITLFTKCGYERNDNDIAFDVMSPVGTDTGIASLGLEYFPLGTPDIRLFAFAARSGGYFGGILNRYDRACLGLIWKIDMLTLK